jgi:putative ABC transport system permease protein
VISYIVGQRTHEIGVRMALGAQPAHVLRLILTQGAKMALIGIALGLAGSLALTRLIANMLFGVSAYDPLTFAGVAVLLIAVALSACYVFARRAMRSIPSRPSATSNPNWRTAIPGARRA